MSAPWFPVDWPGWHYQDALDPTYTGSLLTPDDQQWRIRDAVPCPLCGAPNRTLCASPSGTPTFLIHTQRFRLSRMEDIPGD